MPTHGEHFPLSPGKGGTLPGWAPTDNEEVCPLDQRPIGVFDSGLGGLTAVRQLRQLMPAERIIYFGDTARVPYGNRSRDTLVKYARQDLRFLRSFDLKAVVISCGLDNSYGHPNREALDHFAAVGATVYRTDLQGSIIIRPSADGSFTVATEKNAEG